jgi:hypothetical protein
MPVGVFFNATLVLPFILAKGTAKEADARIYRFDATNNEIAIQAFAVFLYAC